MKHDKINRFPAKLRPFLLLWSTQTLSALGSSMTSFALVIWAFQQSGSALHTALLSVCTYAPYVLLSIFAGALSDRWNRKVTMLACDLFAACTTVAVLALLLTGRLRIYHLYLLNALSGLMNTVQQPASDVAVSLLTPKQFYQRVSGLRSFSSSLTSVLTPALATALYAFSGLYAVILVDLATFALAFCTLLFAIRVPSLPGAAGGEGVLGAVNTAAGLAMLVGSLVVSALPAPKSRVRVICNALLVSMSTENFFLAFGQDAVAWCLGAALGWLSIPLMNANMDVLFRTTIPIEMQGRVYAARNTLQFFTIPLGYLAGGFLVDNVFEPLMAAQPPESLLTVVFGAEKGSGAALLFLALAFLGILTCLVFRRDPHIWKLETEHLDR